MQLLRLMKSWYNAKCCTAQKVTLYTGCWSAVTWHGCWRLAVQLRGRNIPAMEYSSLRNCYCQTLVLVLRLGVDFVLPLSQEEQEQEEEQPPPKSKKTMLTTGQQIGT